METQSVCKLKVIKIIIISQRLEWGQKVGAKKKLSDIIISSLEWGHKVNAN